MENAITIFCNHYAPCILKNATHFFTTKEIQKLIEEHTGSPISKPDLHQKLSELSFTYDLQGDEFVWLMLKK